MFIYKIKHGLILRADNKITSFLYVTFYVSYTRNTIIFSLGSNPNKKFVTDRQEQ